jgi:hypothetical protein
MRPAQRQAVGQPVVYLTYFQWPPCAEQTRPVLSHLLQVSLVPPKPRARPPLHPEQSCNGREHFRQSFIPHLRLLSSSVTRRPGRPGADTSADVRF